MEDEQGETRRSRGVSHDFRILRNQEFADSISCGCEFTNASSAWEGNREDGGFGGIRVTNAEKNG